MDLNDTARVRHPISPVEYRLGTIIAIENQPGGLHGGRYRLRFPTGDERTYYGAELTACSRGDDKAALIAAMTSAARSLISACRIAHDFDDELSAAIMFHNTCLIEAANDHLDGAIDPAHLRPGNSGHGTAEERS
ncbi:hypothetical protein QLQ12_21445 [Actinoplanes sp. NEAU-A12]|uniref:Uncharacterized protein n=1 Tax=Actinoplanes sandaracinus TaxID=3045177 RepID=A0ABT6WN66_9ACTN|nr:hypothetical protein [Actinoplanes sandaracinus]MDI6101183.1 hypothetical protein [Actinoplanes sandaracinus]